MLYEEDATANDLKKTVELEIFTKISEFRFLYYQNKRSFWLAVCLLAVAKEMYCAQTSAKFYEGS